MVLFYPMLLRTHIIPSVGEVCVKDIAPEKATKAESIKRSFILTQEKEPKVRLGFVMEYFQYI